MDGRGESDGMERACHATAWLVLVMLVKDKRGQRLALMWRVARGAGGVKVGLGPC